MATRINKYLSEVGYCSRREADRLILEGKVTINGKIPEIGTKVEDSDQVEVKGQRIEKSKRQNINDVAKIIVPVIGFLFNVVYFYLQSIDKSNLLEYN